MERFIANMDGVINQVVTSRSEFFNRFFERGHMIREECGWPSPEEMTPQFYRSLYDQDAIAARVVEVMPKECFQGAPTIYESEHSDEATEFEEAWDDTANQVNMSGSSWHAEEQGAPIWEHILRADITSGIGQFGIILLGLDDGKNLQDPVDGVEVIANTRVQVRNLKTRQLEWVSCQEVLPDHPPSAAELADNEQIAIIDNRKVIPISTWENGETREIGQLDVTDREDSTFNYDPWVEEREAESLKRDGLWKWDRQTQACVLTDRGRIIVNKRGGQLVTNHENNVKIIESLQARRRVAGSDRGGAETLSGRVENKTTPDIDPYLGRSAGYPGDGPFIQGTDRQYSQGFGLGMPAPIGEIAPSLSGTDQQYFGVQFGPSESFADKPAKKKRRLVFLRCFSEDLVQVVRYEWNIRNPRFGLPVMYRVTLNDPRQPHSGVGLPLATVYVHWSRVIHIADNLLNSEIFGFPRLKQVLPEVLDRRKVRGAGAEGYWQSCFPSISLETAPTLGGDVLIDEPSIRQMMVDYKARLQRYLVLMGMSAKTLPPSVVDPTPHLNACIEAICIKIGCPIRVFKGSERGELASSQDDEAWNKRKAERQQNYITPKIICPLIDRLIQIGVLPEPKESQKEQVQNLLRQGFKIKRQVIRRDQATGRLVKNFLLVKPGQPVPAFNYDEDQPRDEAGRFADGGGTHSVKLPKNKRKANLPQVQAALKQMGYKLGMGQSIPHEGKWVTHYELTAPSGEKKTATAAAIRDMVYEKQAARNRFVGNQGDDDDDDSGNGGNGNGKDNGKATKGTKDKQIEVATGGYRIEWPDVDALGKKDKAGIAFQNAQTLQLYAGPGGMSNIMSEQSFFTKILGWTEEESQAVVDEATKRQEEEEQERADLADEQGYVPQAPEGYKDPSKGGGDGFGGDTNLDGQQQGGEGGGDGQGGRGDGGQQSPDAEAGMARKEAKAESGDEDEGEAKEQKEDEEADEDTENRYRGVDNRRSNDDDDDDRIAEVADMMEEEMQ
jgi:hypothetical protein